MRTAVKFVVVAHGLGQGITAVEGLRKPEGCSTGDCARDHAPDEKSTTKRHLRHKSHRAKHIEEQGRMHQFMAHVVLDKWMTGFFFAGAVITLMLWQSLIRAGSSAQITRRKILTYPGAWLTCMPQGKKLNKPDVWIVAGVSYIFWTAVFSAGLTTIKNFALSKLSKAKPGQPAPGLPIFNVKEVRSYICGSLCGCVALCAEDIYGGKWRSYKDFVKRVKQVEGRVCSRLR